MLEEGSITPIAAGRDHPGSAILLSIVFTFAHETTPTRRHDPARRARRRLCPGQSDRRSGRPADLRRRHAPLAGREARAGADGFDRPAAHRIAGEPRGERLARCARTRRGESTAKNEQYGTWRDWTRGPSGLELVVAARARARGDDARLERADTSRRHHGRRRDRFRRAAEIRRQRRLRALAAEREGKARAGQHAAADLPSRLRHSRSGPIRPTYSHAVALRDSATAEWSARFTAAHVNTRALPALLERAGAAGVLSNAWSRGWGVDKIQSARGDAHPVVRRRRARTTRLLARLADNGQHPRVHATAEATLAPQRVAGVQHDRAHPGQREAERVRHALGASRFVGCRERRDGQRHRHDHDARGDAHPEDGVSASEAHDPRRPLERRRGGRHRLVARSRPIIRRSSRGCRRCSIRTTARARSTRCRRTASSTRRRRSRAGCRACRRTSRRNIVLMMPGVAHNESTDSDAFDCRDAPALLPDVVRLVVRRLHLAHEPRHLRQDQLRQREAERDAGRDVRVSGVGGSGESRVAHAARAAD